MRAKPTLAFVTYARQHPTAQIGVLKRVLRIARHLADRYELRLLHFGVIPGDPLIAAALGSFDVHLVHDERPEVLSRLLDGASQLVFGEAPLFGTFRRIHRIAHQKGMRQSCIDNHYGDFVLPQFRREWPLISKWLLLGLDDGRRQHDGVTFEIVPPLVDVPPSNGDRRGLVAVLGYDADTLRTGMEVLRRLPADVPAEIYTIDAWVGRTREWAASTGRTVAVSSLPGEETLTRVLARSVFVVCKNGFQQMVESLLLGARVMARVCPGGVADDLVAQPLRPWIRYVADERDLGRALFDAAFWLAAPSPPPWQSLAVRRGAGATRYASDRLVALLEG